MGRLFEYRYDAGEHAVCAPIEHVARVGPYLIKARLGESTEEKLTISRASFHNALLGLHHLAGRIDKLHVEYTAQTAQTVIVRTEEVSLPPYYLVQIIGSVVQVNKHLLTGVSGIEIIDGCRNAAANALLSYAGY